MFKINNLTYQYDKTRKALDNVSMDFNKGNIIGIIGSNGSGKSTLAKHINALLLPTEGTIWIDGIDTSKESELWKVRQKAGMVFQNPDNQIIGTVVEEDVGFGPENMGISTGDIWKRVDESLAKTGMTAYRHHSPNKLSGGQKQRAAIASAIASGRSVLFLDEPTSGLDHKHMLEVAEVLREVWDTGISVYVITHDLELIIECCTDVIHFENGTIADQYQMDAEGMEKIRKYFIQGKCCGKWSKSD